MKKLALVGYSGHAYVVADTFLSMEIRLLGYFEKFKKENNPFHLPFLGWEGEKKSLEVLKEENTFFFACIGNNRVRAEIIESMLDQEYQTLIAQHPSSFVSEFASVGEGSLVAPGCKVNAMAKIGKGVILNTGSIIEHECVINNFTHIAPGVVLAGNVKIGDRSFIGANSVVKEGVTIGRNVTVGAGAVILSDIPDNEIWVGNPGRKIKKDAK